MFLNTKIIIFQKTQFNKDPEAEILIFQEDFNFIAKYKKLFYISDINSELTKTRFIQKYKQNT